MIASTALSAIAAARCAGVGCSWSSAQSAAFAAIAAANKAANQPRVLVNVASLVADPPRSVVYRKAPGAPMSMLVCTTMAVLSWQCAPRHTLARHGAPQMVASTAPMEPLAAPLRWREEPDNLWTFTGWSEAPSLTVNYIVDGPEDGQPFLLIHGFGASGFHWRRNVPALAAAGYRVYAIDLVGFGCRPALQPRRRLHRTSTAPAPHTEQPSVPLALFGLPSLRMRHICTG